ncbi:flagellin [Thalassotalea atypica]|uniref:flagellin n=1 Tax=Thalassotalea atypica TaxID=2054316 RepID=UPI0025743968|nr:flagellin [Thalassotalea atypica]
MELSVNQTSASLSLISQQQKQREEEDEKIASGKRINGADDDPAGLQIASRLTAEINENAQLSVNAQDQINYNTVQEGGLTAINDSLQRANELSVASGSPLNDSDAIQNELDELTEQINALAGEVLGDPNFLAPLDASDPSTTQDSINTALEVVNEEAVALGANSSGLSSQVSTYDTSVVNVSNSRSRIEDTDFAETTTNQEQLNVLLQASIVAKKDDEEARKGLLINQVV